MALTSEEYVNLAKLIDGQIDARLQETLGPLVQVMTDQHTRIEQLTNIVMELAAERLHDINNNGAGEKAMRPRRKRGGDDASDADA